MITYKQTIGTESRSVVVWEGEYGRKGMGGGVDYKVHEQMSGRMMNIFIMLIVVMILLIYSKQKIPTEQELWS